MSLDLNKYLALQVRRIEQFRDEYFYNTCTVEESILQWQLKGKAEEFRTVYTDNIEVFESVCYDHCKVECKGITKCDISYNELDLYFGKINQN